ncbi:unnamed protein product [Paramecium sonneborni]|uniref:Protein kinase domain-containing protein n=1 Tax=Paramecium sonneborni TaxID=65129 RepID=A0A8S1RIP9_9CILI|nr:unnamed protein product [Paramecium sonneborni]
MAGNQWRLKGKSLHVVRIQILKTYYYIKRGTELVQSNQSISIISSSFQQKDRLILIEILKQLILKNTIKSYWWIFQCDQFFKNLNECMTNSIHLSIKPIKDNFQEFNNDWLGKLVRSKLERDWIRRRDKEIIQYQSWKYMYEMEIRIKKQRLILISQKKKHRDTDKLPKIIENLRIIQLWVYQIFIIRCTIKEYKTKKKFIHVAPGVSRYQFQDYKVNLFSPGVILFILLTGEIPFQGYSQIDDQLRKNAYCKQIDFKLNDRSISSFAQDFV